MWQETDSKMTWLTYIKSRVSRITLHFSKSNWYRSRLFITPSKNLQIMMNCRRMPLKLWFSRKVLKSFENQGCTLSNSKRGRLLNSNNQMGSQRKWTWSKRLQLLHLLTLMMNQAYSAAKCQNQQLIDRLKISWVQVLVVMWELLKLASHRVVLYFRDQLLQL